MTLNTEITAQPLETLDYGKHMPPASIFDELQLKAKQRSVNSRKQTKTPTGSAMAAMINAQ